MDFNEKLNELIFKYDIDRHCPNYKKYVKAIALAKNVYASLKTRGEDFLLLGIDKTDVIAFLASIGSKDNCQIRYYDQTADICPNTNVLLVSYYQKDKFIVNLLERNVNIISLYDFFEENGLKFTHNFYDIYNEQYWDDVYKKWAYEYGDIDINRVYFYHRRKFELEKNADIRKLYLEKMIFDCTYAKDFLMLKENIDEYALVFGDQAEKYNLFYQEIETLLEELKNALEARKAEDCILFWLDKLEYGMDEMMPFLKGINEKALVFDKAFTVTPYTSPTFITLLTGKMQIEDETYQISSIGEADSILVCELLKRGYYFKYYGNCLNNLADQSLLPSHFYRTNYYSFTQLYWDVLTDMAETTGEQKCFYIMHELNHTHFPYVSFGLKGTEYFIDYRDSWFNPKNKQQSLQIKTQQIESRKYTDLQLAFWSRMLPDIMYKIYMSDHGETPVGTFHTIMKVQQKDICPGVCNSLVTYADFIPLVLQLLDNHAIDENVIRREYALVQEVALYNKDKIKKFALDKEKWSEIIMRMGYQGVVTEEDMLICCEEGREYYQKHINDNKMVTDSRLSYLRGLISKKKVDYFHIDKFKYTRILIVAEQRRAERTKDIRGKKQKAIEDIFCQIQDTEVLALRGGGYHTLNLLMPLEEQYRNKVKYIIDGDRDCIGGKMGIEVITLDEMLQKGVTTVLISSYQYLQEWKEELESYGGIRIINLYKILEERGLPCEMEVCFEKFVDEDFDLSLIDEVL